MQIAQLAQSDVPSGVILGLGAAGFGGVAAQHFDLAPALGCQFSAGPGDRARF